MKQVLAQPPGVKVGLSVEEAVTASSMDAPRFSAPFVTGGSRREKTAAGPSYLRLISSNSSANFRQRKSLEPKRLGPRHRSPSIRGPEDHRRQIQQTVF